METRLMENPTRPIDVLLVEDNPGDIRLAQEALKEGKLHVTLNVVRDGYAALDYLFQRGDYATAVQPDVILPVMPLREVRYFFRFQTGRPGASIRRT